MKIVLKKKFQIISAVPQQSEKVLSSDLTSDPFQARVALRGPLLLQHNQDFLMHRTGKRSEL